MSLSRRNFLRAAGTAGLFGVVRGAQPPSDDSLSVRVWFTDAAAEYPGLTDAVEGYLGQALQQVGRSCSVSFGGTVSPIAEGRRALFEYEWPLRVLGPTSRSTGDVNVLVTDRDPRRTPAGYGMDRAAVVSGARYLAQASAPGPESAPAPYTVPAAVAQLLLHEVGHALGLSHDHGQVTVRTDSVVVTPMVSGYAWADEHDREAHLGQENSCGTAYDDPGERRRLLSFAYGPCASRELRS